LGRAGLVNSKMGYLNAGLDLQKLRRTLLAPGLLLAKEQILWPDAS